MMTRQARSSKSDHGIRHPHDLGNRACSAFKRQNAHQAINRASLHLDGALRPSPTPGHHCRPSSAGLAGSTPGSPCRPSGRQSRPGARPQPTCSARSWVSCATGKEPVRDPPSDEQTSHGSPKSALKTADRWGWGDQAQVPRARSWVTQGRKGADRTRPARPQGPQPRCVLSQSLGGTRIGHATRTLTL